MAWTNLQLDFDILRKNIVDEIQSSRCSEKTPSLINNLALESSLYKIQLALYQFEVKLQEEMQAASLAAAEHERVKENLMKAECLLKMQASSFVITRHIKALSESSNSKVAPP